MTAIRDPEQLVEYLLDRECDDDEIEEALRGFMPIFYSMGHKRRVWREVVERRQRAAPGGQSPATNVNVHAGIPDAEFGARWLGYVDWATRRHMSRSVKGFCAWMTTEAPATEEVWGRTRVFNHLGGRGMSARDLPRSR